MRKFKNAIKVGCNECQFIYWTEQDPQKGCCKCGGPVVEMMNGIFDYDWKRQLESVDNYS